MGNEFRREDALAIIHEDVPRIIKRQFTDSHKPAIDGFFSNINFDWIVSRYFRIFPEGFRNEIGFRDFLNPCVMFYCMGWNIHRKVIVEALSKMERGLKENDQG